MHRTPILPAFLALSACAGTAGDYPSLLPRAIEGRSMAESVRPSPVATTDPALDAKVARLTGQVLSASRAFTGTIDAVQPRVTAAKNAPEGSEQWLGAQVALAEVDVARAAIDAPVSDLERLAIDRAAAGKPPYPTLDRALADATAASRAQRARINELSAILR